MAHLVEFFDDGKSYFKGIITSNEILKYTEFKEKLQLEIPNIEQTLKNHYGNSLDYKYFLGKILGELLDKHNISIKERRLFWDEIKNIASIESRTRSDGKFSKKRKFYEQCYILSKFNYTLIKKLSWRQWQSLLDRDDKIFEDKRFFEWIQINPNKIKENEWRELLKIMNFFLDKKDTSVFSNKEVYEIYDSMLILVKSWISNIKQFEKLYPKSKKLNNKSKWSVTFYRNCLIKNKIRYNEINNEFCLKKFNETMKIV